MEKLTRFNLKGVSKRDFYRVTRNFYITVIVFPRVTVSITKHSVYRQNVSAEIILLYFTLA